jgi:thiol-disulfide isomerase/thioredoxin
MGNVILAVILVFLGLMVGMQVLVRVQARAMRGRPVPPIPGPLGKRLSEAPSALVYFMSPSCGACRVWTPKIEGLRKKNDNVVIVDVSKSFEVARALKVMATPSAVELRAGRVAGVHVGAIPGEVLARFA